MNRSDYMAIKPQFLAKYVTKYDAVMNAGMADYVTKDAAEDLDTLYKKTLKIDGDTATINVMGPLSENGPDWIDLYLGYYGTAYKNLIRAAEEIQGNDKITRVIVKANTPGGNVDGLEEAYKSLAMLASRFGEDLTAYNMGSVASAGIWYISAATRFLAANPASMAGSIGIVIDAFDLTGFYTEAGIKEIILTNTDSPNKWPDITEKSGQEIFIKELDDLYGVFVSRVAGGRTIGVDAIKALKGEMVIAADAVRIGLMDGIDGEAAASAVPGNGRGPDWKEAGKIQVEEFVMDQESKDAFAAINKRLDAMEAQGKTEEPKKLSEKEKTFALNIVKSGEYPATIVTMAGNVLAGDESYATLSATVTAFDAVKEKGAGETAAKEGEENGETEPKGKLPGKKKEANGILDDEDSVKAEMARVKESA
jgi:ClpP class serine protease